MEKLASLDFDTVINILLLFETLTFWKENSINSIKSPDFGLTTEWDKFRKEKIFNYFRLLQFLINGLGKSCINQIYNILSSLTSILCKTPILLVILFGIFMIKADCDITEQRAKSVIGWFLVTKTSIFVFKYLFEKFWIKTKQDVKEKTYDDFLQKKSKKYIVKKK